MKWTPCENEFWATSLSMVTVSCTPSGSVARRCIGIPQQAVWVSYVLRRQAGTEGLFPSGGFLYFDGNKKFLAASRVVSQSGAYRLKHYMEFNEPVTKTCWEVKALLEDRQRW